MSSPLLVLKSTNTLRDAVTLFNHHHIHGAPVIDKEKMMGIITMSDIAKSSGKRPPAQDENLCCDDNGCG